jgi:hypothetical protein
VQVQGSICRWYSETACASSLRALFMSGFSSLRKAIGLAGHGDMRTPNGKRKPSRFNHQTTKRPSEVLGGP